MGARRPEQGAAIIRLRKDDGLSASAHSIFPHDLQHMARNVLGGVLESCSNEPVTGFYRDGCCTTGAEDRGRHVVCAQVTAAFLRYSAAQGNDLITARPELAFPGLSDGDRWCLCVARWVEALGAGVAPPVVLEATHEKALDGVALETLQAYALDAEAT